MNIITSLLENDLYKFTMAQVVFHNFSNAIVEYEFKCRTENNDLVDIIPFLKEELFELCTLEFNSYELQYLNALCLFDVTFFEFLRQFKFNEDFVWIGKENNNLVIRIKGPWLYTIFYEIPLLAIINELNFRKYNKKFTIELGKEKLKEKINIINKTPLDFKFSDFGLRRRFSHTWHEYIIKELKKCLPNNFIGTSNVYLAMKCDVKPIGTMAHEFLQAMQTYVHPLQSQKYALNLWLKEYNGKLGIALSDVINIDAFLKDFDYYLAKQYDGCRHDSGDPYVWGNKIIDHYKMLGIDPLSKLLVFSDNLTVPKALDIEKTFNGDINTSYGIGTNLTNDVGVKPLNIVIKMTKCNGLSVAKISDSPGKSMCNDANYINYLKTIFNVK